MSTGTGIRKLAGFLALFAFVLHGVQAQAQTTPAPTSSPSSIESPLESPLPATTATPAPFLVAQPVSFTLTIGGTRDVKILGANGALNAQLSSPIAQVTVDLSTIH
ncbi:MAG: hypothetical protein ACREML_09875, partial [Vulcanimicrobiaceae bacterium]